MPLFSWPPHSRIERVERVLAVVQEQYGLSDIYLYRSGTGISAICLRTFPLRRLEKIIRASASANYGTLVKYKQLFFRVGDVRDENQNLITGPPEYVKTIAAPEENNIRFVSLPHHRFIRKFSPVVREYSRMHGDGAVTLVHTVNEE